LRVEVRIRMGAGTAVTRHYVVSGFDRALCGRLTLRPPAPLEAWAPRCGQCETNLSRMERES
jgi:hypothetical protein